MVLSGAVLFPHALLPLHIFEPRYRAMLAHALAGERMICIALTKPGIDEARRVEDFFEVACIGLVRACVGNPDGTSNLILQGLARVRFTEHVQKKPFHIARLEPLQTTSGAPSVELEALGTKVVELCGEFKERGVELPAPLQEHLQEISNLDFLADLVAAQPFFVSDPCARQQLLETPCLTTRLRLLIQLLQAELKA